MSRAFIFIILFLTSSFTLFADKILVPEDVLTSEEIDDIVLNNNFFHYQSIDDETPIWVQSHRKYSQAFLEDRIHSYSNDSLLHKLLTDSYPIQYSLEQIYRAKMGIHSKLGNILPQLNITFGESAAQLGLHNAFSNLLAFVLPSNWLKLANQEILYETTRLMLAKVVLDQIYTVKTLYLTVHQLLTEYEILNYYFMHMQVFVRKYPQQTREALTIKSQIGSLGGDVANKRADIRAALDTLAGFVAFEKFGSDYTGSTFSIDEIKDFPPKIQYLENVNKPLLDPEHFLRDTVEKSLELKIAEKLYKMSKLDVGITAFGGVLSNVDRGASNPNNDARFALTFGYGNIPNILISKSLSRTAKLDVGNAYINLLTSARLILDQYKSAIDSHSEGKRALYLGRIAFKKNLEFYAQNPNSCPDGYFMLSLNQLIKAELNLNAFLHSGLLAHAAMDRYLLIEEANAFRYLPGRGEILHSFKKIMGDNLEDIRKQEEIDSVFEKLKSTKQLKTILYHPDKHPIAKHYTHDEIKEAVRINIGNLLYSKYFFYKQEDFYKTLSHYVIQNEIELTQMEHYLLAKKRTSFWSRFFPSHRKF